MDQTRVEHVAGTVLWSYELVAIWHPRLPTISTTAARSPLAIAGLTGLLVWHLVSMRRAGR